MQPKIKIRCLNKIFSKKIRTSSKKIIYSIFSVVFSFQSLADERDGSLDDDHTLVITSTREEKLKSELAESVTVIDSKQIEEISPSHPAELLNRVPGVYINNLGGEGHMSSIRQPITTSGVYLFLEDGIPTRPSGFFNHNGLYEINIPQSSRIEVIKGTGSALYGSDAIGGIINSITRPSPESTEFEGHFEFGSFGWKRGLISVGTNIDEDSGFRIDVNVTDNDGYRDESAYSRKSTTVRYDNNLSAAWDLKTVFSYSKVEQSGVSSLEEDEYRNNPKKNLFHGDIGFREVDAYRLSAEFSYQSNDSELWTFTPYFRDNQMVMTPSWMVTYDPNFRTYKFDSYGAMIKYRNRLSDSFTIISGVDFETTPSSYQEESISVVQDGDIYVGYALDDVDYYNFDATQNIISPYIHSEWKFANQWIFSLGGRYDYYEVDYEDKLAGNAVDSRHLRPESQKVDFDNFSPKLGLVYQLNEQHNAYFNYRYSFVAPSVGRLFRPGSSQDSENLKPIKSKSYEIGFRGHFADNWRYEAAIYNLEKSDDIVTFIDGSDRKVTNAGETSHKGIEIGLQGDLSDAFSVSFAWTKTEQKYEEFGYLFQCFSPACGRVIPGPPIRENRNFAGFDVGKSPESLGNVSLQYYPTQIPGLRFELEMEHVGEYFTDETNTLKYGGHDLFNLRSSYEVSDSTKVTFRVMNVTDKIYSTYTTAQVGDLDISYRPGLPRAYYLGFKYSY
ncbi:TonB-dependent receptor [Aliikangiella coralliicola]|uniref:TonB-dependent receptor n=1 Tax=Aliikangiella coralliicola TaxID=2592383 RepID=A0A545TWG7_9GAMM|nr:TonB-dependent receptor [Aliikangiella coralliicola]TQV81552.1 TonB-dependent receptor [Aliikangiella coralliicola]